MDSQEKDQIESSPNEQNHTLQSSTVLQDSNESHTNRSQPESRTGIEEEQETIRINIKNKKLIIQNYRKPTIVIYSSSYLENMNKEASIYWRRQPSTTKSQSVDHSKQSKELTTRKTRLGEKSHISSRIDSRDNVEHINNLTDASGNLCVDNENGEDVIIDLSDAEINDAEFFSKSRGQSLRRSRERSRDHSRGKSRGHSRDRSRGHSRGKSRGRSRSRSRGRSRGKSRGNSRGRSRGHSRGKSRGHSRGRSRGHSRGKSRGHSRGRSSGHSRGKSRDHARGRSRGHSRGKSRGYSRGRSRGHSRGKSIGHSKGRPRGHFREKCIGRSRGRARGHARHGSRGHSQARSRSHSRGTSTCKHHKN